VAAELLAERGVDLRRERLVLARRNGRQRAEMTGTGTSSLIAWKIVQRPSGVATAQI
jgi:hypothetical protein